MNWRFHAVRLAVAAVTWVVPSSASSPAADAPENAQAEPSPPPPEGPFSLHGRYATGEWLGLRPALSDRGIRFNFYYNHYHQKVLQGGRELNGSGRGSGTIDAILDFDLEKLKLIQGGQLFVHARRQWGAGVNPFTGALQQVNDDADGDRTLHIDQLWYGQRFGSWLTLRIGFLDFQTIVDRNAFANSEDTQFWNQALDNNPIAPFIPLAGLGAAAIVHPVDWYTAILGVGDADTVLFKPGFSTAFHGPARFYGYFENDFHVPIPSPRGPLEGNYRVGLAYDPVPAAVFDRAYGDPERRRSEGGDYIVYASFDQMLYREDAQSPQGLGWFFRYAYRKGEMTRVSTFWSTGVQYRGPLPRRDRDVVGAAIARLIESPRYRRFVNENAAAETIYELYYAIQVTDWLVITPDVQYITHPGGDATTRDVFVAGVRTRISF